MDTSSSRYQDVQFQGKTGSLLILSEKIIFRPAPTTANTTKTTSRSWRWTAIERVEVLDPSRGSSLRSFKLKSNKVENKAVTISVPGNILNDVLKDINARLVSQPDALGIEGPVLTKTPLTHKDIPPFATRQRRKSTTSANITSSNNQNGKATATTRRSSLHTPPRSILSPPKKITKDTVANRQSPSKQELTSTPAWSLQVEAKKPLSSEVEDTSKSQERSPLLHKVGLKYSLLKPPEKYRPAEAAKDEAKQHLLQSEEEENAAKGPTKQRGFLHFMKPPPPRRNITNEIAELEQKSQQQQHQVRTKEAQQKYVEKKGAVSPRKVKQRADSPKQKPPKQQSKPKATTAVVKPLTVYVPPPPQEIVCTSPTTEYQSKETEAKMRANSPKQKSPQQQSKPKATPAVVKPPTVYVPPQEVVFTPPTNKTEAEDIVFTPTVVGKKEDEDATSRTSATSAPESPAVKEEEEPTHLLWNPSAPENKFKMMILQHAATCPHQAKSTKCPYDPICSQHRQILDHIETCPYGPECTVDRCKSTKAFLMTMRLMTNPNDDGDKTSTKDFLIGVGATAPVPVIHVGEGGVGDWDAFSVVSDSTWWERAGA